MMTERESTLMKSLSLQGRGFRAWVLFLSAIILWGIYAYSLQFRHGLIETGMRDQISWGLYISNFVFFIGISHAGTLISAILRVTDAGWRKPITRLAEGITVVSLCIGGSMVLVDIGRPERLFNVFLHGRIQSPIVWDILGVTTYLTGSLLYFYLPLMPDLAIIAAQPGIGKLRRAFFRFLSFGWTGSPKEWHVLEKGISVMAVAIIPLAVSVHTVVSWIFAMTLRPGWDSSIFGPYFVVGAIYSGAAAVVLAMCVMRSAMNLEQYLEPIHFRNLGLLLLAFSGLYLYFNINEYLTVGYKFQGGEKVLLDRLFTGDYALYFWATQVVGVALPMILMIAVLGPGRYRQFTIPGLGLASFMVVIGAWAKRYLIVVPTLSSPYLPIQRVPESWSHYTPSWVEWSITAAAFAAFMLLYTLISKVFPVVSVWETRGDGNAEAPVEAPASFGPRTWGVASQLPLLLICGLLLSAGTARAQDRPASKPGKQQPTVLSVSWSAMAAEQAPASEDARLTPPVSTPDRVYLFSKSLPFQWSAPNSRAAAQAMKRSVIAIAVRLLDVKGLPMAFEAVNFKLKTSLGKLDYGNVPTDSSGNARLIVRDRRYGRYPVSVGYRGDDTHAESLSEVLVDFGPRPAPSLPEAGVLISPTFSPSIGVPFLAFYGSMWCVFAYVVGYLLFWRMRRERLAAATGGIA